MSSGQHIPVVLLESDLPDIAPHSLAGILDSLDALVYVSDMQDHRLLYMNAYGRRYWGNPGERRCWEVIQSGQSGPCAFCTNDHLVKDGQGTGVYVWEFRNTVNGRWYQCRDQAIRWQDGRLVRLEIATDITERKAAEEALQRAKDWAESLAHTDDLTGLDNRRAFFALGQQVHEQAARNDQALTVIMFDIDHFKQINDHFGHSAGDQVLVAIGNTLRPLIREGDIFARMGGEEFAILMPGATADQALFFAERLRKSMESLCVKTPLGNIGCTASFGLASSAGACKSLEKLLSIADQAMYRAKIAGRNNISLLEETA